MKNITLIVSLGVSVLIVALVVSSQQSNIPLAPLSGEASPTQSDVIWTKFPASAAISYQTEALYQQFEHGFMVWRSDENCAYALTTNPFSEAKNAAIPQEIPIPSYGYGYCLVVDALREKAVDPMTPGGHLDPEGPLTRIWNAYAEVQIKLGAPIGPVQAYRATIPTNRDVPLRSMPYSIRQMTLPDGSILECGSRAATSGSCFVVPTVPES